MTGDSGGPQSTASCRTTEKRSIVLDLRHSCCATVEPAPLPMALESLLLAMGSVIFSLFWEGYYW